jgi:predicted MFS family arabinose efflux permease
MTRSTDLAVTSPSRGRTLRTVVPGTATIAVTFGLARYGYGLLLPDMQSDIGLSASAAGMIASAAYLSYLLANTAVVGVVTWWGPRTAVGCALVSAAGGMAVIAGAHSAFTLAVGVLVAGASAGLAYPPYADIVSRDVHPRRRDVAWSTISSGTGWGVAVAGPIAIVAGDRWRAAWLVFVGIAVVVGVISTLAAPAHTDRRARRPQLSWTWFLCPRSRPLLVSAVLVGLGSSVWWAFGLAAMRASGTESSTARLLYAVCGVAGLLGSLSGAAFSKMGLRAGYLVTCSALAVSLALFGLEPSRLAFAAAVLFGASYNSVIAAQGVWSSRVFSDHPAAGLAAVNTALTIGTLVGPPLAGAVIENAGYSTTFVGVGVVALFALPFCPASTRKRADLDRHQRQCSATPARP